MVLKQFQGISTSFPHKFCSYSQLKSNHCLFMKCFQFSIKIYFIWWIPSCHWNSMNSENSIKISIISIKINLFLIRRFFIHQQWHSIQCKFPFFHQPNFIPNCILIVFQNRKCHFKTTVSAMTASNAHWTEFISLSGIYMWCHHKFDRIKSWLKYTMFKQHIVFVNGK